MSARGIVVIAVLVAACGGAPSPAPTTATHAINGSVALTTDQLEQYGGFGSTRCRGLRGYDDITEGAAVVVKNEAAVIIATSTLANSERKGRTCTLNFAVSAVPDAAFYSIEVSHRGALTYSRADMEASGWTVSLTLGD